MWLLSVIVILNSPDALDAQASYPIGFIGKFQLMFFSGMYLETVILRLLLEAAVGQFLAVFWMLKWMLIANFFNH